VQIIVCGDGLNCGKFCVEVGGSCKKCFLMLASVFVRQALDLWMAGCMVFVFAALGEFAVVKVLDVRYQLQKNARVASVPRVLPMVSTESQTSSASISKEYLILLNICKTWKILNI
jgi:hypothetical protein